MFRGPIAVLEREDGGNKAIIRPARKEDGGLSGKLVGKAEKTVGVGRPDGR